MGWNAHAAPNAFARQSSSAGGKKPFAPKPSDHLVTITAYNLKDRSIVGVNQMGNTATYRIEARKFHDCEAKAKNYGGGAKFMGHRIDDKMEAAIPVGRKIVMEKAVYAAKDANKNNVYDCTRVINATAQDPDKLFVGLFSAARRLDRVASVQSWSEKAFAATDRDSLKDLVGKVDADFQKYAAGERVCFRGIQLRALRKDLDQAGWICFDSSLPYDYIPGTKDEHGNELTKMSPLSKEKLIEMCKGYQTYLTTQFPDFVKDGCVLEVMTYTSYKASDMSGGMAITHEFSSLNKMTTRPSRIAIDDLETFSGKNVAGRGIIELTDDKATIVNKQAHFEVRNMVQKLHANSYIGDVREMVFAADGEKVRLDPLLRVEAPVVKQEDVSQDPADHAPALAQKSIEERFDDLNQEKIDLDAEADPFGMDDDAIFGH